MVIVFASMFAVTTSVDAGMMKSLKKKVANIKGDKKKDSKEEKGKNKVDVPPKKSQNKYDYETSESGDRETDIKKILPPKSEYTHWITSGVFGPADG